MENLNSSDSDADNHAENVKGSTSAVRDGVTIIHMVSDRQHAETRTSDERKIFTCLRHAYYCFTANKSFTHRRRTAAMARGNTINSVSKIDRASRILFPLSFFVVNVFYWWAYATKNDEADDWTVMKKYYHI